MITVEINDRQTHHGIQLQELQDAVRAVLLGEGVRTATVSVAVVDDPTILDLNRRYLQHDYPTDVLSFVLERGDGCLDGEVIVSAETAGRECHGYGWAVQEELMLYTVHGSLHLVGFDDQSPCQAERMRVKEQSYLNQLLALRDTSPPGGHSREGGT